MDPQANLSFSTGADTETNATIYDVLRGELKPSFAVQHMPMGDIIPSNILLSGIELEFTGDNREFILSKALGTLNENYDYIFIDSPPGLGILTVNALVAADYAVVPMLPDIFSLQGITLVYDTIEHVKNTCNPKLEIAGILLNKFSARSRLGREIFGTAQMISESLDMPIFNTFIRSSVAISEAQSSQMDITKYARYSASVVDFMNLTNEMIGKGI
jgi:chromosome partitioning protein